MKLRYVYSKLCITTLCLMVLQGLSPISGTVSAAANTTSSVGRFNDNFNSDAAYTYTSTTTTQYGWRASSGSLFSIAPDSFTGSGFMVKMSAAAASTAKNGVLYNPGYSPLNGNVIYSAKMRISTGDSTFRAGIAARYEDSNNYYMVSLANNKLEIRKKVGGTTSTIASGNYIYNADTTYTLTIGVNGSTLFGSVIDPASPGIPALTLTTTDTSIPAGGTGNAGSDNIALYASGSTTNAFNAYFDDVTATDQFVEAPTDVNVTTGENGENLVNWTASSNAASYLVKRATASGGPYTTMGSTTSNQYSDPNIKSGTSYYYIVSAVDANTADGIPSKEAALSTAGPKNMFAVAGDSQVNLSWWALAGASSYNVYRMDTSVAGQPYTLLASNVTSTWYTDSKVNNGTLYNYFVRGVISGEETGDSNYKVAAVPGTPFTKPGMYNADGSPHKLPSPNGVTGKTLDVTGYGAIPNDSGDDTLGIQAAINAAQPGDEVYIPNGIYHLATVSPEEPNSNLVLKSGVNLRGESQDKVILVSELNPIPANQPGGSNQNTNAKVISAANLHDMMISSLTISSSWNAKYSLNSSVSNPEVGGPAYGIYIDSSIIPGAPSGAAPYNITVDHVTVEKFQRTGIRVSKAHDVVVQNCIFRQGTDVGVGGAGYGVVVQGGAKEDRLGASDDTKWNVVQNNTFDGTDALRHGVLLQYYAHNNVVSNNRMNYTVLDSIDLHGEREYLNEIYGNTILGTRAGGGVGVGNTGGGVPYNHSAAGPFNYIHDNVIQNSKIGMQIYMGSPDTIIENNTIEFVQDPIATTPMTNGLVINNAPRTVIKNNTIRNNTGSTFNAILLAHDNGDGNANRIGEGDPKDVTITGNTITGNTNGINIAAGTGIVLENNTLKNIGTNLNKAANTEVFQTKVISSEDSLADYANSSANFGNAKNISLSGSDSSYGIAYFKFDVTQSSLVSNAQLQISGRSLDSRSSYTLHVYGVPDNNWSERTITWNNSTNLNHDLKVSGVNGGIPLGTITLSGNGIQSYDLSTSALTDFIRSRTDGKASIMVVDNNLQNSITELYTKEKEFESVRPSLKMSLQAPAAPSVVTAAPDNSKVDLSWDTVMGAASYNVYRSNISGGSYTLLGGTSSSGYTDTGLSNGVTYYYVVTAANPGGESVFSSETSATPMLSSNADLSRLALSTGALNPSFQSEVTDYRVNVGNEVDSISITPQVADAVASLKVDGVTSASGALYGPIHFIAGTNTIRVDVTAASGVVKTYTITVEREAPAPSTNANLNNLTVSTGAMTPSFGASVTGYTVNVGNEVDSLSVTPTVADAGASLKVNGVASPSGASYGPINLIIGTNTIRVEVTAASGAVKTYTVSVERKAPVLSTNADLSNLTVSTGVITPSFSAIVTNYSVNVGYEVGSMSVTPTVVDAGAKVKVNGTASKSGSNYGPLNLEVGNNVIRVEVTAASGVIKTYTITVNRAVKSLPSNANLSHLTVSTGTMTPSFDSNVTGYIVNVGYEVSSIYVTPTVADTGSTVKVNGTLSKSGSKYGPINLGVGNNAIRVDVTAPSGVVKTYTITVNRATKPLSSNANLSNLKISTGSMLPWFSSNITGYMVFVENGVSSISVTPTVADAGATIRVNGVVSKSGSIHGPINLVVGTNTIRVEVTAANGVKKTYSIIVNRADKQGKK